MSPDELDDLILGHLEGRSSPEEGRRLEEALALDPAAARRFAELSLQESLLHEMAESEELGAAAIERRSIRPRRGHVTRPRAHGAAPAWWIWVAAAAAFMILVTTVLNSERTTRTPKPLVTAPPAAVHEPSELQAPRHPAPEPPLEPTRPRPPPDLDPPAIRHLPEMIEAPKPKPAPPPPPPIEPPPRPALEVDPPTRRETTVAVATLERFEGVVEFTGEGIRAPARPGRVIVLGEGLRTGDRESFATVRLQDGTRFEIEPSTALTRFTAGPAKSVHVGSGRVTAFVPKQPPGQSLRFTTPQGEATVLGTTLRLMTDSRQTHLEVIEGKVRMTRLDGRAIDVVSGHYAVAAVGAPLASKPLPPLFEDGFDADSLNEWPKGWRQHDTEAATRSGYRVLQDAARPRDRFLGCPNLTSGLTQHAVIPLDDWPLSLAITFRLRLTGNRITRAGIEIGDGRMDPSIEYDAEGSVLRVDWPRGTALKQAPFRLATGTWTEWVVTVDGGQFRIAIDRKPVLEAGMTSFGRVRGASLVSRGPDPAQFDNVKVVRR